MEYHGEFVPGDPDWDCQARLEEAIERFIGAEFGEGSIKGETTVRDHVRDFLGEWRKSKAGN